MEIVVILMLFGIAAALIASAKGRSALGWFVLGVLFGPFGLLVAVFPKVEKS